MRFYRVVKLTSLRIRLRRIRVRRGSVHSERDLRLSGLRQPLLDKFVGRGWLEAGELDADGVFITDAAGPEGEAGDVDWLEVLWPVAREQKWKKKDLAAMLEEEDALEVAAALDFDTEAYLASLMEASEDDAVPPEDATEAGDVEDIETEDSEEETDGEDSSNANA